MADPLVSVVMGSRADLTTMQMAIDVFVQLEIPYEARVVSPHRSPEALFDYARELETRGVKVIIAGSSGAAHLPGMIAALTILPVLGVPVQSHVLDGLDSLLSMVQMPRGVPVGTLAIGGVGAWNAALLAAHILSLEDAELARRVRDLRDRRAGAGTEILS